MFGLLTSNRFRRGRFARVRSFAAIKATLDADGKLSGLPFMPEMLKYCGKTFRIQRRVEKVFLDHFHYVGRMPRAVLLENVRCSGQSHGGCEMGCLTLWKEQWLEPVSGAAAPLPLGDAPPETPELVTNRRRPTRSGDSPARRGAVAADCGQRDVLPPTGLAPRGRACTHVLRRIRVCPA